MSESELKPDGQLDCVYLVADTDGGPIMTRLDGNELSRREISDINKALKRAYKLQQAAHLRAAEAEILVGANWVFPMQRRDLRASGDCVYFAESTNRPGWIKIGMTGDLYKRREALQNKRPGRFEIYAYIVTEHAKTLEKALHLRFAPVRDGKKEFFRAGPVLDWIDKQMLQETTHE